MAEIIIFIASAIALYLNIAASVYLTKSDMYSSGQKAAQYLFIWLAPVIGAAVVLSFLMEEPGRLRATDREPSLLFRLVALTFFFEAAANACNSDKSSRDSGVESDGFNLGGYDGLDA